MIELFLYCTADPVCGFMEPAILEQETKKVFFEICDTDFLYIYTTDKWRLFVEVDKANEDVFSSYTVFLVCHAMLHYIKVTRRMF